MRFGCARLVSVAIGISLVVAACGGGDDASPRSEPSTTERSDVATERAQGEATGADLRESAEDQPVHGGRLVYALEADSQNPWTHYATSCAISCRMVLRTITDSLFVTDEKGDIQPYLVDAVEPNETYTTWTMTIKEGISFHDGTPLDGAAVKYNIDVCRFSPLTGPAFLGLDNVEASGQTVALTYSQPEAIGPKSLRAETCGMMLSPTWMATLANNPMNAVPFISEEQA